MAEVKEGKAKEIRVMAGTFPAAHGDQARKLADAIKAAKIAGFSVVPAKMPGYIQVAAECKDEEAAKALIAQVKAKKFRACIAE